MTSERFAVTYTVDDIATALNEMYEEDYPDGVPEEWIDRLTDIVQRKYDHSHFFRQIQDLAMVFRDQVEGK